MLDQFWLWSMQSGLKNACESLKAFSETDFTEDQQEFDVPTLVLYGEDDQELAGATAARPDGGCGLGRRLSGAHPDNGDVPTPP